MTTKIKLPDVTLITVTGKNYQRDEHKKALQKSYEGIDFGSIVHVESTDIFDVESWNTFISKELYKHFYTTHCLLIHSDGYVIHPELWKDEWLQYDFAGSPWPLPTDSYSYRNENGEIVRVGNSVGLRSRRLMHLISTRPNDFHFGNNNEDGNICTWNRSWLESLGCKFMPFEEALNFGREIDLPEHQGRDTFLFHSTV